MFLYSSAVGEGGMCIPTFVDFFLFHFFFLCLFRFLFLFFLSRWLRVLIAFFFLPFSVRCQPLNSPAPRSIPIFFHQVFSLSWSRHHCNVSPLSSTTHSFSFLNHSSSYAGWWSTSGSRGVTHISCHHKNTIGGTGENRRTNEQTRAKLGVNQEQKEVLQHYMHVRTIASVSY